MKITFFTARYSLTGVPLAQIRLAKLFLSKGYNVDFILGYVPKDLTVPKLDGINVINFNHSRVLTMFGMIIKYLKNTKPDIIISAEDHLNTVVLTSARIAKSKAKISVSFRISATRVYRGKFLSKSWFMQKALGLVYHRADVLACVSKDMAKEYNAMYNTEKFTSIYNVIVDLESKSRKKESIDEPWLINKTSPVIISAGTLTKRKGFHILIMAMKEVIKTVDIKLIILGEGYQREILENMIKDENMTSCIKLVGHKSNPLKYYYHSDIYVLSSYSEGLPNVLVEAMMCGCTPVSTDCPTGPREVLQEEKYGYLVPMHDPKAMAEGIKKALQNPISPEHLAEGIKAFTEDEVFAQYKKVLGL